MRIRLLHGLRRRCQRLQYYAGTSLSTKYDPCTGGAASLCFCIGIEVCQNHIRVDIFQGICHFIEGAAIDTSAHTIDTSLNDAIVVIEGARIVALCLQCIDIFCLHTEDDDVFHRRRLP